MVTYEVDASMLRQVLTALREATAFALHHGALSEASLVVVDNGPGNNHALLSRLVNEAWRDSHRHSKVVTTGLNLGYGKAHNLALEDSHGEFHLVLNPDVIAAPDALLKGVSYMAEHPNTGLVTPYALDAQGQRQYLCKRYPTVLDLVLRGFAPRALQAMFQQRLHHYEMRGETENKCVDGVLIASGCFMLLRRSVMDGVGGFSPEFFLYFEDFDLSIRISQQFHISYVPQVRICHYGGGAARKGLRHMILFLRSAGTFFRTHGWRWL